VGEALGHQWHCLGLDTRMMQDSNDAVECDRCGNAAHT